MTQVVLSLFPGIGLLDRAFEEEGFCVVRGPDRLWGGDIKRFHVPAGRFDGVIGGPPCQRFSRLANIVKAVHGEKALAENLIPEFERIVGEAQPAWFLMENVPAAPLPVVPGYIVRDYLVNNRECGGEQNRERRFSFGTRDGRALELDWWAPPVPMTWEPAVCSTAGGRRAKLVVDDSGRVRGNQGRDGDARLRARSLGELCRLQGLPEDYLDEAPFTDRGKRLVISNGVPLPMGRAIARAVRRSLAATGESAMGARRVSGGEREAVQ